MSKQKKAEIPANKRIDLILIHPDNIIIRPAWNPKWGPKGCPLPEVNSMVTMIEATGVKVGDTWESPGSIIDPIRVKPEFEMSGKPLRRRKTGRYILVHGERRTLGGKAIWEKVKNRELPAKVWGNFMIPASCVPEKYSELEELLENYTGNTTIQIKGLSEAIFVKKLLDGFTQEDGVFVKMNEREISARIGKSITHVKDIQLLLEAPEEVQELLRKGKIKPTFVIENMKEYKNPETVKNKILAANEEAEKSGSDTVSNKHINKVENRLNSVSLLKKVINRVTNDELSIPKEKKKLYDFFVNVFDGKLSGPQIEIFITNQLSIKFPHVYDSQESYEEYVSELQDEDLIDEIPISRETSNSILGRQLAGRAIKKWDEDFVDEDSGEVVTINRSEVVINSGTILTKEHIDTLIDSDVKIVLLHKES